MREIAEEIKKWKEEGKSVAVATIVKANGSPMRPIGSKMAVTTDQKIAGSVTGGCIEGDVYEKAQTVIQTGRPQILHYGVASDQTPWEIGLSCGSSLDVFVESMQTPAWDDFWLPTLDLLEQKQLLGSATILNGEKMGARLILWPDGKIHASFSDKSLEDALHECAESHFQSGDSGFESLTLNGETVEVFIDILTPPARLIIIGAVHLAIPMVALARTLGLTTLVVDPRKAFANRERFPDADELIVDWPSDALEKLKPDQGTFVAAVSHDDKLDNPALAVALKSPAKYVGVLGNRRNIPKRMDILREMGVSDEQLKRLHAPIGHDLGSVQPEEIALSVLAEIISVRHGQREYRW